MSTMYRLPRLTAVQAGRIDTIAALGVARTQIAEQSADDLRPEHIARCREWIGKASESLDELERELLAELETAHTREMQRRRDALTANRALGIAKAIQADANALDMGKRS